MRNNNQEKRVDPDEPEFEDLEDDEEFIPCSNCDGHPACEDFGCAFEQGLGHLVENNDFNSLNFPL